MTALLSSKVESALRGYGDRAVVTAADGAWQMSGAQLIAAAEAVHGALGPQVQRPLILYLHKSPLYYAWLAASFINGLAFCPLDIDNPVQRVVEVADQLPGSLVICDCDEAFTALRATTERCIRMGPAFDAVDAGVTPDASGDDRVDTCYYIATSGSTGVPKLVQVPHDRTIPFIEWAVPFYRIDSGTRWAQFSSIGFDLSLVDFLSVICGGGTLVSLATPLDRLRPALTVRRSAITHWHSVPSMIPYFVRDTAMTDTASTCRLFTFCGEPLMKDDADRLADRYPDARIINTYGPTEATLFCSFFEYTRGDATVTERSLPIGQPIPSWNFVLVPDGDALRLVIVSDNVAHGYVGVASPLFGSVDLFGRPMGAFDTGDYVRTGGPHLYFSHRTDGLVKIHGQRIDLGDIEAAARKSGLMNPVALVVGDTIALVAEGNPDENGSETAALDRFLPRTSLPSIVRFVPSHPRTISGKLDRRAIQAALADAAGR